MLSNHVNRTALLFVFISLFAASCTLIKRADQGQANDNTSPTNQSSNLNKAVSSSENPDDAGARSAEEKITTGNAVAKAACMITNVGPGRAVEKSQTFAIEFEPFKGACFITSYNPEYGDIHEGSEFAIYKAGRKAFTFPGQFNGSTFGCWVDGVGFRDLNHDGLIDVIVVGRCAAKSGDYNENMVYVNTGRIFTAREDANNQLGDLRTIKEISDFVEDNQQIFFK